MQLHFKWIILTLLLLLPQTPFWGPLCCKIWDRWQTDGGFSHPPWGPWLHPLSYYWQSVPTNNKCVLQIVKKSDILLDLRPIELLNSWSFILCGKGRREEIWHLKTYRVVKQRHPLAPLYLTLTLSGLGWPGKVFIFISSIARAASDALENLM